MLWAGLLALAATAACGETSTVADSEAERASTPTAAPPPEPTSAAQPTRVPPTAAPTAAAEPTETAPSVDVGSLAPEFRLAAASGPDRSLESYRGDKSVVLVFYRAFW